MTPLPKFSTALVLPLCLALLGAAPVGATPRHRVTKHHRVARHHHKHHAKHHHAKLIPPSTPPVVGDPAPPGSGACANTDLQPTQANLGVVREATRCLINMIRAQHGLGALAANATLGQTAQSYAVKMIEENFFAHVTPSGQTPLARLVVSGYLPSLNVYYRDGENLGWGAGARSTPAAVVNDWVVSPEHLGHILNPSYRETGIGIAIGVPAFLAQGQGAATYVEEFGSLQP